MNLFFGKELINPTLAEFQIYDSQFSQHRASLKRQNFTFKDYEHGKNSSGRKWTKEIWEKDKYWVRLAAQIVGCALLYCFSDYKKSFHDHLQNWDHVWRTGKRQKTCKLYAPLLDPEAKKSIIWAKIGTKFPKEANLNKQQFDTIYAAIDEKCSEKNTLELIEAILKSDSEIQNTLCQLISKGKIKKKNNDSINYSEYCDYVDFDTSELVKFITKFSDFALKSPENRQKVIDTLCKTDPNVTNAKYPYLTYDRSLKTVLSGYLEMFDSNLKDQFHTFSIKLASLTSPSSSNNYQNLYTYMGSLSDETIETAERLLNNQAFLSLFQKPFLNSATSTRVNIYTTLATLEAFQKQKYLTFLPDEILIEILTRALQETPLDIAIANFLNKNPAFNENKNARTFIEAIAEDYPIPLEQAENVVSIIDNNTKIENNQIARLFQIYFRNISNKDPIPSLHGQLFSCNDTRFCLSLLQAMNEIPVEEKINVGNVLEMIGGTPPHTPTQSGNLDMSLAKLFVSVSKSLSATGTKMRDPFESHHNFTERLRQNYLKITELFLLQIAPVRSLLKEYSIDLIRSVVAEARELLLPLLPIENGIAIVSELIKEPSPEIRLNLITQIIRSQGPKRLKDNYLTTLQHVSMARVQLELKSTPNVVS